MQLTNILVAALATTASAASVSSRALRRQAANSCRLVAPSDFNFGVADLASGTIAKKTLNFNVGSGATGPCSLIANFDAGFPVDQGGDAFARIDVRNAQGALVGSFGPLNVQNDVVVEDTFRVINSFQCQENLSFEFAIANDADVQEDINLTFTGTYENGFFVQVGDQCN